MKRRLIICGVIIAAVALVWLIPDFSNTRAEKYNDARAAAQRELETIGSLYAERALIERGDRLEPKLAAQVFGANSNRTRAIADSAKAQAAIVGQLAAIDRQIEAHQASAKEAIWLQKSLAPEK